MSYDASFLRYLIKKFQFGQVLIFFYHCKRKFWRICISDGLQYFLYFKGQIISKGLFGVLEFSQKTNKRICRSSKNNSSVHFLGKLKDTKSPFEIIWPLGSRFKKDETRLFPNAIWEKCKWKVQMFILVTLWQLLPCHFNAWCVAKAMEYVGFTYLYLCNPLSYYIFSYSDFWCRYNVIGQALALHIKTPKFCKRIRGSYSFIVDFMIFPFSSLFYAVFWD
jgi:hypothetical protein